jgi:hypothetical protein
MTLMRARTIVPAVVMLSVAAAGALLAQARGAPETFTGHLHATGPNVGAMAAAIQIDVKRYTPDAEREAVETALKTGGYAAFLTALRKAPEVGGVTVGQKKWTIRWAREVSTGRGRTLTFVTDQPMFFVGGGAVDAKPRAGFEVALIQLQIDNVGIGDGTMAAAARVKPGGESGVQVEDYAEKPIKITTVTRRYD